MYIFISKKTGAKIVQMSEITVFKFTFYYLVLQESDNVSLNNKPYSFFLHSSFLELPTPQTITTSAFSVKEISRFKPKFKTGYTGKRYILSPEYHSTRVNTCLYFLYETTIRFVDK